MIQILIPPTQVQMHELNYHIVCDGTIQQMKHST